MILDLMLQKGVLCSEELVLPIRTGWTECTFENSPRDLGLPRFYAQLQVAQTELANVTRINWFQQSSRSRSSQLCNALSSYSFHLQIHKQ